MASSLTNIAPNDLRQQAVNVHHTLHVIRTMLQFGKSESQERVQHSLLGEILGWAISGRARYVYTYLESFGAPQCSTVNSFREGDLQPDTNGLGFGKNISVTYIVSSSTQPTAGSLVNVLRIVLKAPW